MTYRKESGKPVSIDHEYVHDKKCELISYIEAATSSDTSEGQAEAIGRILREIAYHEADTHDQGYPFGAQE